MKIKTLLLVGIIGATLISCSDSAEKEKEDIEDLSVQNEEKEMSKTPIKVSWEDLNSGDLVEGQMIILEGYIQSLPKSIASFDANEENSWFTMTSRRNQSYSYVAMVSLSVGTEENQMHKLPDPYTQDDLKIVTNFGNLAGVSSRVQVIGAYSPGFLAGSGCSIDLTEVKLLDEEFDKLVLESAIELNDNTINDPSKDSCYSFMDVQLKINDLVTMDNRYYWIDIKQKTNSFLTSVLIEQGTRAGTVGESNDNTKLCVFDIDGAVVNNGSKVRLYGSFRQNPLSSRGVFIVEEIVAM